MTAVSGRPPAPGVVIVKPGSMGDVIHALPVLAALGAALPGCPVSWVVDTRWAPLLEGNPHLTHTIEFPREHFRGVPGLIRALPWALGLRRQRPGICLDLQGLLRSALIGRMTSPGQLLGLSDAREGARWFYDDVVPVEARAHSVHRYLSVLNLLGLEVPREPEFWLPSGTLPASTPAVPYILVHPFSRGAGKSLPAGALASLCKELAPTPVVLAGGAAPMAPEGRHVVNLLGTTSLAELIGLIRGAAHVVSVDSGPAHLAAALERPLLAIHTWTDPQLVGPYSTGAWIWQGGEIRRQTLTGGTHVPGGMPDEAAARRIAAHVLAHCTAGIAKGGFSA